MNILRIPLADAIAAVVLSILVTGITAWAHPKLTDESFTMTAGRLKPEIAEALPAPTYPAEVTKYDVVVMREHEFTLHSPEDGLFTVTGATFRLLGALQSMSLWVNEHPVTYSMLEGEPAEATTPITYRPIARNVHLRAGENTIHVRAFLTQVPIVLRFERQEPFSWTPAVGAGIAAFVALWSLSLVTGRLFGNGPMQPVAIVAGTLALTAGAFAWMGVVRGADFIYAGNMSSELDLGLEQMDKDIAEVQSSGRDVVTVATFGDSTHAFFVNEFKGNLARRLEDDRPGEFSVYGLSHGGLTGRDYYLLVSKIMDDKPDIIVLPINVITFEPLWYDNKMWHFHALEQFLPFGEFPHAFGLSVGTRRFRWDSVMVTKIDATLFDRKATRFLYGLQLFVQNEARRMDVFIYGALKMKSTIRAQLTQLATEGRTITVEPDNDVLETFRAINRLTRAQDVRVIYYTTPVFDSAQQAKDVHFQPDLNFGTIREALSNEPHVTFMDLHESFPDDMFRDDIVHLTREGIKHLADQVALEIERISATDSP